MNQSHSHEDIQNSNADSVISQFDASLTEIVATLVHGGCEYLSFQSKIPLSSWIYELGHRLSSISRVEIYTSF